MCFNKRKLKNHDEFGVVEHRFNEHDKNHDATCSRHHVMSTLELSFP